ncbi:pancreatic lipase-related protein [Plakobranchus ocellatus]|uniref:Pancreatic lipase-related protein n=1 Tax=Plakobranchus ocellatus TaxID=259542 RepID=A0AAV3ZKY6_9GAST|nr:pancreatic lipase-related protein [Plakobranchus ocellatus]
MLSELKKKEDANYITVDWEIGASNVNYYQSVANTRVVGAVVALVLQALQSLGGDPAMFHLIGYSLGAHIAGYAGDRVEGIGRITGLDPAGPAFEGTPAQVRLDPTDALLVDVIHTDGAQGVGLGTMQAMGDIDFYPNRGVGQPGCPSTMLDRLTAAFMSTLRDAFACSHLRVLDMFSASINNICPSTSLSSDSLRLSWSNKDSNDEDNDEEWLPCETEESCPVMGYDLSPASVELCHLQRGEAGGDLLVAMQTTGTWPFCCKSVYTI